MKIRVKAKQTLQEGSQPKLVAEITVEMTPDDVRDALPGRAQEDFYRNFGEEIIEAIQNYKPYGRA